MIFQAIILLSHYLNNQKNIFKNESICYFDELIVIKQPATTVPLLTRFVWQIHHIVYRLMVKIVSKIQESFVITQETHLHGVIFMIVQVIVQQLMGKHATIHGRECI